MRPRQLHVISILLCIATSILLTAAGCASDRSVISQANQVHTSLQPAVINDSELSSYIQQVGDRVIAAARELDKEGVGPKSHTKENADWMFGKDMKFHLVNSKTLNA